MNSEVHTGVKSAGCEKRITQLPEYCSGKLISPWVVTALKAGALSPMRGSETDVAFVDSIVLVLLSSLGRARLVRMHPDKNRHDRFRSSSCHMDALDIH